MTDEEKIERYIKKHVNPELENLGLRFDVERKSILIKSLGIDFVTEFRLDDNDIINEFIDTFCDKKKLALLYRQIQLEKQTETRARHKIDKNMN